MAESTPATARKLRKGILRDLIDGMIDDGLVVEELTEAFDAVVRRRQRRQNTIVISDDDEETTAATTQAKIKREKPAKPDPERETSPREKTKRKSSSSHTGTERDADDGHPSREAMYQAAAKRQEMQKP